MTINNKDISVVVQGQARSGEIEVCLSSIRKYLPGATIILSTWEGSNIEGLDYDKLVLNKDPGPSGYRENVYKNPDKKTPSNINRQIVSTINGLKAVETKYAMKLRTDFQMFGNKFLNYFDKFQKTPKDDSLKIFERKVLCFLMLPEIYSPIPFFVCDFSFFGLTKDLITLFDIPLQTDLEAFYFEKNKPVDMQLYNYHGGCSSRYGPEEYIVFNALSKKKKDIFEIVRDWTDTENNNVELGRQFITTNFIVLEDKQYQVGGIKKENLLALKNFKCFETYKEWYKKYCDPNYIVLSSYIGPELKKLDKYSKQFYKPIESFVKFLRSPFYVLFYSVKICLKFAYVLLSRFKKQ